MGYSRDEVKAIIERAIDAQTRRSDDVSHDELLSIGRELGLSGEALEAAASSVRASRELDAARAEVRARERLGFIAHLISFALVNVGAIVTWLVAGGAPWFLAVLIPWGIGLAYHADVVFWPDAQRFERTVRRQVERERRVAERRARKEALDKVKRELGAGVAQALTSVADAVSSAAKHASDERSRVRVEGDAPSEAASPSEPESREDRPASRRAGRARGD